MEGQEKEHKHKNRLKGLFSKEKKAIPEGDVDDFLRSPSDKLHFHAPTPPTTSSQGVDDFLHGPSDRLTFATPTPTSTHPPLLTRIDTSSARRWPTAAEIPSSTTSRRRSISAQRSRKGLVVRFTDEQPEVIGEGGDEAELPTISLRQRAQSHPPGRLRSRESPPRTQESPPPAAYTKATGEEPEDREAFRPGLLRRAQTGFESISDAQNGPGQQTPSPSQEPEADSTQNGHLETKSHDPTSFAVRVQAEMRAGEGLALLRATSHPSDAADGLSLMDESPAAVNSNTSADLPGQDNAGSKAEREATTEIPNAVNERLMKLELPDYSPVNFSGQLGALGEVQPSSPSNAEQLTSAASIPPQLSPGPRLTPQGPQEFHSAVTNESTVPISRTSTLTLHGAAVAVGDDAVQEFSRRVTHLFNIFLLSAESRLPISKCSLEDFVRAALWWFLKGRLHLESTIRDRPATPEGQQTSFLIRQQAYADLGKSLWILETITPQYSEISSQQKDAHVIDVLETRKAVLASLRKLTMSMKRNNFLPPEEATLPQGLDTSIWVQDSGNHSLLASQKQAALPNLNDYFPLGDTNRSFHYGRAFAGAVLIEDADSQSQDYRSPVLISIIRTHKQTAVRLISLQTAIYLIGAESIEYISGAVVIRLSIKGHLELLPSSRLLLELQYLTVLICL
jgi:hypothetical protein